MDNGPMRPSKAARVGLSIVMTRQTATISSFIPFVQDGSANLPIYQQQQ